MSNTPVSKWNFRPWVDDVPGRSGEDSSFDHFKSTPYRFIVREYIQNSVDVPGDKANGHPVTVVFSSGELKSSEHPEFIGSLVERMEACQRISAENENSRNVYASKVEYLKERASSVVPFLKVSDFFTTGMPYSEKGQSNFRAGVRQMGASHKSQGFAGGSHGLGKTVGFVASAINAVYYSTMLEDEETTYGEGVIRLCMHTMTDPVTGEDQEYHPDAFFDSNEGKGPDKDLQIPEDFRRSKPGTDVYIIGVEPNEEDWLTMKKEAIRSFFTAIIDRRLIVEFDGDPIDADNIEAKLNEFFPIDIDSIYDKEPNRNLITRFNPRPYFNCVLHRGENSEHYHSFEATSDKYPKLGHATLTIYTDELIKNASDDRIVCMRDKEMVIEIRNRLGRKGYYGVFICDGEGSQYLRMMETVTHDEWSKKELEELDKDTRDAGSATYNEIDKFIDACVAELFPASDEEELRVPLLDKYLVTAGLKKQTTSGTPFDSDEVNKESIQDAVSTMAADIKDKRVEGKSLASVVVRRKGGIKKKKSKTGEGTLKPATQAVPAPKTPPVGPGPGPGPNPNPDPKHRDNDPKTPNNPVTGEVGHESPTGAYATKKSGSHTANVTAKFRTKTIIDDYGLIHRIIIDSDKDYSSCSMVISLAGEEKDTAARFSSIDPQFKIIGREQNILTGFDLVAGKNYIDIRFEDNDPHSLIIKAYEN